MTQRLIIRLVPNWQIPLPISPPTRSRHHYGTERLKEPSIGRNRTKEYLLDIVRNVSLMKSQQLWLPAQDKIKPFNIPAGSGKGLTIPTPCWGIIRGWWLLEEGESIFKGVTPSRLTHALVDVCTPICTWAVQAELSGRYIHICMYVHVYEWYEVGRTWEWIWEELGKLKGERGAQNACI